MENATWLIIMIATVTALLWYYEHKTVQLELRLVSALDRIEELTSLESAPPFNLEHSDPVYAEAFKLDRHLHPQSQPKLALVSDRVFSQAEIDAWN